MTNKKQYVKPRALDLSGLAVIGFNEIGIGDPSPLGSCQVGSNPTSDTCSPSGSSPTQDPAHCAPTGFLAQVGGCDTGTSAYANCGTGSIPD